MALSEKIMNDSLEFVTPALQSLTVANGGLTQFFWDHTDLGIWILEIIEAGRDFRWLAGNPAMDQISPVPMGQLLNKRLSEGLPSTMSQRHQQYYRRAIEQRQPLTFEEVGDYKQQLCWWSVKVVPIGADQGPLEQLIVTFSEISQYKQAEIKHLQSIQTLQLIIDRFPSLIVWKDRDSIFQGCNQAFAAMTPYQNPSELVGKTDYDMPWSPEETAWYLECDRNIMAADAPQEGIIEPLYRCDGQQAWLSTSKIPLHDDDGQVNGILVVIEDVTERQATQAALSLRDQAIAVSPVSIVIVDAQQPDFPATYVNPAFEKHTGYAASEVLGRNFRFLQGDDNAQPALAEIRVALAKGERCTVTLRNYRKDGALFWNELTIAPILDGQGQITHFMGLQNDVTSRYSAEALFREYANFQTLLNHLSAQIRSSLELETVLTNALKEIQTSLELDSCSFAWVHVNARAPRWEVIKEACVKGSPSFVGVYPASILGDNHWQSLIAQQMVTISDSAMLSSQGVEIPSQLLIPVSTRVGKLGCLICSYYDQEHAWSDNEVELLAAVADHIAIAIDQAQLYAQSREQADELIYTLGELKQTQARMVQNEKMSGLGQMVAGVAHEINNPINFIHGNLIPAQHYAQDLLYLIDKYQEAYPNPSKALRAEIESLDLDYLREDFPRLLQSMQIGTDRICEIVKSLRIFSRLDEADLKVVDIHEGLDSTLMILNHRLKSKAGKPTIEIVKVYGSLPLVSCYAGQLNQVFMNILVNAIDALESVAADSSDLFPGEGASPLVPTPSAALGNPTITLETQYLEDQWVKVLISDNGSGIPEVACSKLFDPFFTTKPVGQGTGLGLSISHQVIVDRHQGKLYCESTLGQGTTFVVMIPVKQC